MARYQRILLLSALFAAAQTLVARAQTMNTPPNPHPAPANAASEATDVDTIKQRVWDDIRSSKIPDPESTRALMAKMTPQGTWPDIDYHATKEAGWQPMTHLARLRQMALSYGIPNQQSLWYKRDDLKNAVLRAYDGWFSVLPGTIPHSDNWWHNLIGVQQNLGTVMLLMERDLSREQTERGLSLMAKSWNPADTSGINTGANLTWRARNTIMEACLRRDPVLLLAVSQRLSRETRISDGEGIQPDNSFWQHGPQLSTLGYSLPFVDDFSQMALLFDGTRFAFEPEAITNLSRLILDGQAWTMRGPRNDYSAIGRGISYPPARYNGSVPKLNAPAERMIKINAPRKAEFVDFLARLEGKGTPLEGNRSFWRSGFMTQSRAAYYTSVRATSQQNRGAEYINQEGNRTFYLGDGANFLLRTGNEYNEIFPVWDWCRVPGVTAVHSPDPPPMNGQKQGPYIWGVGTFAGGVSDGTYGAIGYDYDRHREPIKGAVLHGAKARKSWFFFDREYVCLGASIASEADAPVYTSINQCLLNTPVTTNDGTVAGGAPHNLSHPLWVHQDEVGYVFPDRPDNVTLQNAPQTGKWADIYGHNENAPVTKNVFSLWFDHGVKPQNDAYSYVVVPGIAAGEMPAYSAQLSVKILSNTAEVQAVYHPGLKMMQAVFFAPGSVSFGKGVTVSVSHACVLLLRETALGDLEIAVANPDNPPSRNWHDAGQQFEPQPTPPAPAVKIMVDVSLPLSGDGVTKPKSRSASQVAFVLPTGSLAGQSVVKKFACSVSLPAVK